MTIDTKPIVSVVVLAYKHDKFIGQCLESILSQKTNFPFEILIGEDESPDNTRGICIEYAQKYPEKIKLILRSRKDVIYIDGRPTGRFNFVETIKASGGDYIAVCEGDDYWIDDNKLQKQIDALAGSREYIACYTNADVLADDGLQPVEFPALDKEYISIEDIILSPVNIVPTSSLVFKNCIKDFPEFFMQSLVGDIPLLMLLADKGKMKHLHCTTSVYRHHGGGISKQEYHARTGEDHLFKMFSAADKYFNYRYTYVINERLLAMSKVRLLYGARHYSGLKKVKYVYGALPNYFKYSKKPSIKELLYFHVVWFFPGILKLFKRPA